MGAISIRFVSDADELREVGRFRYAVYVEEMARLPAKPNGARLLIDELDVGAYILAAWDCARIVGTVRVSLCGSSNIGAYERWYRSPEIAGPAWPSRTALLTRLMVAPHFRRTTLSARLSAAAFAFGRARGITCALMDCNEHLLPYFAKFGWKIHGSFDHPDYGWVFTHSLDLTDLAELARLRSPLLRAVRNTSIGYGDAVAMSAATIARSLNGSPPPLRPQGRRTTLEESGRGSIGMSAETHRRSAL